MDFTSEFLSVCTFYFGGYSVSLVDINLFISFYFFLVYVLADCVFQGVGSLHVGYRICGHRVHNILYGHGICSYIPLFICDISKLCPFFS